MKIYVLMENGVVEEEMCKISLHFITHYIFPKEYYAPIKLDFIFVSNLC